MIQRRDLIKLAAGGAAGTALTPLPWKLIDDISIWSQNWSWIPKVPRGECTSKFSTCTVCPAACGVRAQCVGGRAVGLEPAGNHPFSQGVLCPVGFGAHTAAYHPRRARQPLKRVGAGEFQAIAREAAVAEIGATLRRAADAGGTTAILDLGPRRTTSALYADAATRVAKGLYIRPVDREESTLDALARLVGREPGTLGIDLEHTRTIVSFGAPVLDGWAVPGRVMERWRTGALQVVQIEPRQSRTALAAQRWIPVKPGSEASFATSQDFGQQVAAASPMVFIAGGDAATGVFEPSELEIIANLNIEFGAVGVEGGIVPRGREPWARAAANELTTVSDGSIALLFIDSSRAFEATPWPLIQRKLAQDAVVVALAYKEDEFTAHADFVLPVRAPFEALDDAETPPSSTVAAFALAPALIETPAISETPVDHMNAVLVAAGLAPAPSIEEAQKERVRSIHASKRGHLAAFEDGAGTPAKEIASADELYEKLAAGAIWLDDPAPRSFVIKNPAKPAAPTSKPAPAIALLVHGSRASTAAVETSPLLTKLYQESGLYATAALVRINPETARALQLQTGDRALIETTHGSATRSVLLDPAVGPGAVEVAVGPGAEDITTICTDGSHTGWRVVAANVRRA